jgi:two-component system sensor histidine kinase KdpD
MIDSKYQPLTTLSYWQRLAHQHPKLTGYSASILGCASVSVFGGYFYQQLHGLNVALLFVLLVILIARRFGNFQALSCAIISMTAFYTIFAREGQGINLDFGQYLLSTLIAISIAIVTAALANNLRKQTELASISAIRAQALYELSRDLSGAMNQAEAISAIETSLQIHFKVSTCILIQIENEPLLPLATQAFPGLNIKDAMWALKHSALAGPGTNLMTNSPVLYIPLKAPTRIRGVLAVKPDPKEGPPSIEQLRQLETFASLIAMTLERTHYADIAQKVSLRMQSEKMRNSLLTALSHDLRTPLTGLVGAADTLRLSLSETIHYENAEQVFDDACRLNRLVDNLLEMARLQSGEVKLRKGWQSIEEIVGEVLNGLRFALQKHHVDIRIADDLPLAQCDAVLMERVISNLLDNAGKYTPNNGKILIESWSDQDNIYVAVEDNGPGIHLSYQAQIFEKFSRVHKESSIPGVGLGLAICRSIIEAHDGDIGLKPGTLGGARIVISIPLVEPPAPEELPIDSFNTDSAAMSATTTSIIS